MDNRVRILHVITGMGSGGAEMFLMNMYRNMDHEKIVFDFLLQSDENLYKEELEAYGSRIWQIPPYFRRPIQNRSELKKVLQHGYRIIHVHANALMYITPILCAEQAGIPCRIMHSHSSSMRFKWALPYHKLNKLRIAKHATHRFACSDEAGAWMFGSDYTVIRNAVDLDRFVYRPALREQYRQELGVSDGELVIGQIGRLKELKNQAFSLDVFRRVLENRADCRLVFVGEGPDEEKLRNQARECGLSDRVSFLGVRTDVNELINAFDLLLFPSIYEGLGIVTIEAQANGLPVLCSDAVPESCALSPNMKRLSLELSPEEWAKELLSADLTRTDNRQRLADAGFDIRQEAEKLQKFYLNCAGVK